MSRRTWRLARREERMDVRRDNRRLLRSAGSPKSGGNALGRALGSFVGGTNERARDTPRDGRSESSSRRVDPDIIISPRGLISLSFRRSLKERLDICTSISRFPPLPSSPMNRQVCRRFFNYHRLRPSYLRDGRICDSSARDRANLADGNWPRVAHRRCVNFRCDRSTCSRQLPRVY